MTAWAATSCHNIGRRTGETDAAGSEAWSYDAMGRVLTDQRTTNSVTRSTIYSYLPNVDGSVNSITYPSGLVVTYAYNGAGRPISATDQHGVKYAISVSYAPQGALQTATMAATTNFAGFSLSNSYTERLQPNEMKVTNSSTTVMDFSYCFYALSSGACPSSGTTDNGNVMGIINNMDHTRSETFTYDSLNRISTGASVNTSGTNCWGEKYGYDAWANLLSITSPSGYSACTQPDSLSISVTSANQISGYTYDASGNLTYIPGVGGGSFAYNAAGEMSSAAGVTYTYDGDGRRVQKSSGTLYWYGMSAEPLEETNGSGTLTNDYIFLGSQLVARRDASANVFAYFPDHLGSSRKVEEIASGASSATLSYDADFYPYGREQAFVSTSNPIHKFTGKERDTETGNDYFGARYYSSTIGRFMSADWSDETDPVPYADEEDPRTLNLYAYVRNSPSNKRDADGHHQECGPTTYSTDSETGALTVNANCREVPDFFFCFFCSAATQAEIQSRFDDLEQRIALGQVYVYANTLPIGPGDTGALGDLESLLQDLKNGFRPTAESSALQEIVNQLYKTTDTVPGGTAGAVRQEIETGEAVGGKFHSIKAAERARQLEKLINAGTLSTTDTTLAKAILQDLWNALAGK